MNFLFTTNECTQVIATLPYSWPYHSHCGKMNPPLTALVRQLASASQLKYSTFVVTASVLFRYS